jgi:predicted Zn-dependent protease
MIKWRLRQWKRILLAIAMMLLMVLLINSQNILSFAQSVPDSNLGSKLPPLKSHSLPDSLNKWHGKEHSSDYFGQVKSTPLGYLVWSQFPVKIYLEKYLQKPGNTTQMTASDRKFLTWTIAVRQAIAEWNVYLPLLEVADLTIADITILRSQPERKVKLNPVTGLYDLPRAMAAQTNYEFYLSENSSVIAHRMKIQISPSSAGESLLATVRHELGHALGIWGHSPEERDALYYSQVRDPMPISERDINTLKKIYQQPTRLGWKIANSK